MKKELSKKVKKQKTAALLKKKERILPKQLKKTLHK